MLYSYYAFASEKHGVSRRGQSHNGWRERDVVVLYYT